jgi:hypothetical protein
VSGTQPQNPLSNELQVKSEQSQLSISETDQMSNFQLTNHDLSHLQRARNNNNHTDHDKELVTLTKTEYTMNDDHEINDKAQLRETFSIQLLKLTQIWSLAPLHLA